MAHREVHSSVGVNRRGFSRGLEIEVVAEGLELPSTGWWSSLLLLQGISDRRFLGLRLENRCLAQCVPSLQASCFLPYPLSTQKGVIREPIPTSLPAQRLQWALQEGPQLGRRPGFLRASSLSTVSPCSPEASRLWGP